MLCTLDNTPHNGNRGKEENDQIDSDTTSIQINSKATRSHPESVRIIAPWVRQDGLFRPSFIARLSLFRLRNGVYVSLCIVCLAEKWPQRGYGFRAFRTLTGRLFVMFCLLCCYVFAFTFYGDTGSVSGVKQIDALITALASNILSLQSPLQPICVSGLERPVHDTMSWDVEAPHRVLLR